MWVGTVPTQAQTLSCRRGLRHRKTVANSRASPAGVLPAETPSGRSSGVEHDLAKVGVEGSNPFARSSFHRSIEAVPLGRAIEPSSLCCAPACRPSLWFESLRPLQRFNRCRGLSSTAPQCPPKRPASACLATPSSRGALRRRSYAGCALKSEVRGSRCASGLGFSLALRREILVHHLGALVEAGDEGGDALRDQRADVGRLRF